MKILVMIDWYYPAKKSGGPAVSVNNLCTMFQGEHEFFIVTSNHDVNSKEELKGIHKGWNNRGNSKVRYLSDKEITLTNLKKIIKEINPDLIYLNSLFGYKFTVPTLIIANKYKYKVLLAPRGEICKNTLGKKYKKVPYIMFLYYLLTRKNVYFQSTSFEETDQIKKIFRIKNSHLFYLTNIPTTPKTLSSKIKKVKGELYCIFLSRIQEKKNLTKVLEYLSKANGKITLDIYGPQEDEQYWNKCEEVIRDLPENIKVNYKGLVNKERVHETLSRYHLFILPTKSENYGHVIAESLLSRCPILISDQTPWTDVNDTNAGWALPLDMKSKFTKVIDGVANMDQAEFMNLVDRSDNYIKNKLNLVEIRTGYLNAFSHIKER